MGWRLRFGVSLLTLGFACTSGHECIPDFFFQTAVPGAARSCVVTFAQNSTSLVVDVGDLDGGCASATGTMLDVSCTTASLPQGALVCQRGCYPQNSDLLSVGAADDDAAVEIHALFGNPPLEGVIPATVACNGSPIANTAAASLDKCPY